MGRTLLKCRKLNDLFPIAQLINLQKLTTPGFHILRFMSLHFKFSTSLGTSQWLQISLVSLLELKSKIQLTFMNLRTLQ